MAKRLRPLTDACPKCLLEVGGRTLLQRTVEAQMAAGIDELVVITGYREEMIRQYLTSRYPELTIHFICNTDYENNNNIFSLWLAGERVNGRDFLLMDSDILCDPAIVGIVARQDAAALAVNRHELGEEEMKVVVDKENNIIEISKTCLPAEALGESVGIERITPEYSVALYKELDKMINGEGLINVFYEAAFQRLIAQGHTLRVVDTTDYFSYELDTPEDLATASALIEKKSL